MKLSQAFLFVVSTSSLYDNVVNGFTPTNARKFTQNEYKSISCFIHVFIDLHICLIYNYETVGSTFGRISSVSSSSSSRCSSLLMASAVEQVNGSSTSLSTTTPPLEETRLSTCEKARTVTSVCTSGTLCTVSSSEGIEGSPFGSFVDYILDNEGNPVFLMNEMSMHTMNIQKASDDNKPAVVSLFAQFASTSGVSKTEGQDVSRVSVTGTIEKMAENDPDIDTLKTRYSISHAYADQVFDSPYFHFYRLTPSKIYYVGGFGVQATWVPVDEYKSAAPDILAQEASDIVSKLNKENQNDLMLLVTHLMNISSEIERIRVTGVDRLGLDVRVTTEIPGRRNKLTTDEFRVGFRIPVISVEDAKSEIEKVFQEAWERSKGFTWDDGELPGSDVPIIQIAEDSLGTK